MGCRQFKELGRQSNEYLSLVAYVRASFQAGRGVKRDSKGRWVSKIAAGNNAEHVQVADYLQMDGTGPSSNTLAALAAQVCSNLQFELKRDKLAKDHFLGAFKNCTGKNKSQSIISQDCAMLKQLVKSSARDLGRDQVPSCGSCGTWAGRIKVGRLTFNGARWRSRKRSSRSKFDKTESKRITQISDDLVEKLEACNPAILEACKKIRADTAEWNHASSPDPQPGWLYAANDYADLWG